VINISFKVSRELQNRIDFEVPFFKSWAAIAILVFSIVGFVFCFIFSNQALQKSKFLVHDAVAYTIFGCVILLLVCIVICTVNCNSEDGIVLNSANFALYVSYIYRNTVFTLFKASQRKILQESGNFNDILSKFSEIQKRVSQYIFSFLFGTAYNIEGFFEEITHDKIFSITLGLIAMISLTLTAGEWPWVETEEKKDEGTPNEEVKKNKGFEDAKYYLYTAGFVLMTTKFTLNSMDYTSDRGGVAAIDKWLPAIQLIFGTVYFALKLLIRRNAVEDEKKYS